MAKKRTQLRIINSGRRNQKEILAAVASVEGVEKLEIDVIKGVLTVVGEVEPVPIFKALKKICVKSEIMSVGPATAKKPGENFREQQHMWCSGSAVSCYCNSSYCKQCELIAIGNPIPADIGQCSIL